MALDLEDFERRLRAGGVAGRGASGKDDPLAELARLIGEDDPFADLLEPPPAPVPASARPIRAVTAEPTVLAPELMASDEASNVPEEPGVGVSQDRQGGQRQEQGHDDGEFEYAHGSSAETSIAATQRRPRRGRAIAMLASIGALGVLGAAGVEAMRLTSWTKVAPFIAADATPVRVPPPQAPAAPDQLATPPVTALAAPTAATAAKAKLAQDVEQPVDLSALAKKITGGEIPSQGAADGAFPAFQKVKTVSVRPDGSVIAPPPPAPDAGAATDAGVAPNADAAAALRSTAAQDAGAASPPAVSAAATVAELPPVQAVASAAPDVSAVPTPASAAPDVPAPDAPPPTAPKVLDSAAIQSGGMSAPADPAPRPIKFKAKHVGVAIRGQTAAASGAAPLDLIGQLAAGTPASKLTRVAAIRPAAAQIAVPAPADGTPATASAPSSGAFAVQFGVRGSDASAKAAVRSFEGRYGPSLGGAALSVVRASIKGKTLYRIRALHLSRARASSLCSSIKGAGGSCFVTK